ncbi:MAG: 6,7-dimethyl-8-ribityllumazine synthase [Elusimicrobia bacterium]|nr:6,7-dimethyl-8-ribityllumazine synthase [Elusimicrobiota bacterium]
MKQAPRVAVVASRFNEMVTSRLLKNCVSTLKKKGIKARQIDIVRVPGAYEIPWAVQETALSGDFDAVIALGAILKGETPQNHHMARAVILHIQQISLKTRIPCILGVITPDDEAQALARTSGELDRGRESALAALAMLKLKERLGRGTA